MKILLVCLLLVTQNVVAQQYEETIKQCTNTLMNSLTNTPNEAEVKQKLGEFGTCIKGTKIPTFTATSLAGNEFTSQSLEGEVVLINFCGPCLLEIPALNS